MIDHSQVRLGKRVAIKDDRTLKIAKYLTPGLPPPPSIVDWTMGLKDFGYMRNNDLGDCTIAACGHAIQIFTGNAQGSVKTIPDSEIVAAYSAVSGYNPNNGAHDDGANEIDVLNYWTNTGVGGDKLGSYAAVAPTDMDMIRQVVYLFGCCYIGVQLPQSAQGQNIWDIVGNPNSPANQPGSWGGHAIIVASADDTKQQLQVVTWGGLMPVTYRFMSAYCDEAFAILSNDWMNSARAPNCIDLATLTTDLAIVKSA